MADVVHIDPAPQASWSVRTKFTVPEYSNGLFGWPGTCTLTAPLPTVAVNPGGGLEVGLQTQAPVGDRLHSEPVADAVETDMPLPGMPPEKANDVEQGKR